MTGTVAESRRRLVVIGNGMAGSRLVQELRRRDSDGKWHVTVLGDERHPAYNRVLLSNLLAGSATPESLRMALPADSADAVDVRLGVTVTGIDRERRQVRTCGGDAVPYDALVLATGSQPLLPPIAGLRDTGGDLIEGVAVFRTVDDCDRILQLADRATTAVVLGGGLLGLEAARGLAARGLSVELVHAAPFLMERQLDAGAGAVLARTVSGLGVAVRCATTVSEVVAEAPHHDAGIGARPRRLSAVRLTDGTQLPADVLVVACGVRPHTSLAVDSGLAVDRGVVVDDAMRTSDPAIFAIGECAQHAGAVYGLVAPAWEQAAVLAGELTGQVDAGRYRGSRLVTRLKAAGIDLAAMGDTAADVLTADVQQSEVVQFADPFRGIYKKLILRDGKVTGAILLGDTATVGMVTQLFDREAPAPLDRLALLFPGGGPPASQTPALLPDRATVCRCNGVEKQAITACWLAGARSVEAIAERTRATTGCGGCRPTVEGIADWLAAATAEQRSECA